MFQIDKPFMTYQFYKQYARGGTLSKTVFSRVLHAGDTLKSPLKDLSAPKAGELGDGWLHIQELKSYRKRGLDLSSIAIIEKTQHGGMENCKAVNSPAVDADVTRNIDQIIDELYGSHSALNWLELNRRLKNRGASKLDADFPHVVCNLSDPASKPVPKPPEEAKPR